MSTGGYWAAVGDPRYNRFEAARDPNEGAPPDRTLTAEGPGIVDQAGALWPGAQSAFPDAQDVTGYAYDSGQPPDPEFFTLQYYGEVGEQAHPVARTVVPFQDGNVGPYQGFANPAAFRPRLSAFTNQGAIGPLQQRVNPGVSSIAVPDADLLGGFPLGQPRVFTPHLGYVTTWPTAQMVYRPMGPNGSG